MAWIVAGQRITSSAWTRAVAAGEAVGNRELAKAKKASGTRLAALLW
jgi:hypothetical protein